MSGVFMNKLERYVELALRQVDTAGYYLSRYGISDNVNRHTLIALALTRREHLKGELSRIELKVALQRKRFQQQTEKLSEIADQLIQRTPRPVATRLLKAKAMVF